MSVVVAAVAALALGALAAGAALACFARIPCLRRRVIVNLVDQDHAITGVLFEHRGRWLVLKTAELLSKDRPRVAMDGDVVIECARVSFIQVVGS